jgi:hypothetical protein
MNRHNIKKGNSMKKSFILTGILICTFTFLSYSQRSSGTGQWISYTEGGVLVGNSVNENKNPFVFHSSLNYAFHRNLSAGIGLGADFLKETCLPASANVLYQFGKNKTITPFIRLQGGYLIALESQTWKGGTYDYPYLPYYSYYYPVSAEKLDANGGWMFNPSAGVIVYTKSGLGISVAAGYRHQKLNYKGAENYALQVEYNRLSLTLGIIF